MKKILLLLLLIVLYSSSYSKDYGLTKIKIYLVKWNARYTIVRNIDNIKREYLYYFEVLDDNLINMFSDYSDCINKLEMQDTINHQYNSCNACVELFFCRKKITIYFSNSGDYFFNTKWYKVNYGFYYLLFSYFSNELIPPETLNKAKSNMKHKSLWVPNDYKKDE